jgi:hypothetical protein
MCPVRNVTYVSGRSPVFMRARILPPIAFTLEKLFARNLPKIRASPSRRTRDVPRLCRRRRQKEDDRAQC